MKRAMVCRVCGPAGAIFLAAALGGVAAAWGRSCIVNAGTETYSQSVDYSSAQTAEIGVRTESVLATDYQSETRRLTTSASTGRRLSTMPPSTVLLFR